MNPTSNAVLLLGGGHAHALALPILARKFPPDRKLILVSDSARAPYSGMVPGHIAGHYARDECFINLPRLAEKCGAQFISDRVTALDSDRQVARLEKNGEMSFGILSINTGGVPRPKCMLPETDCAVKPVARFAEWLDEWKNESEAKVAIVGAGAGGIEVALALRFRAQGQGRKLQLTLVDSGERILPALPESARNRVLQTLARKDIPVKSNAEVVERAPGVLKFADGEAMAVDRAIFATPVGPPLWAGDSGLALDERGFISVDAKLQTSRPHIFACGDAANFLPRALPKSGVYAVRQGPHLARNLLAAAGGTPLMDWIPQPNTLAILSAGEKRAIAARGGWTAEGAWVWRWKNYLDRRFMNRFA